MAERIHDKYMPFTEDAVRDHFARPDEYLADFKRSADRYRAYMAAPKKGDRTRTAFFARQIEKDEQFWTVTCLMHLFHHAERTSLLTALLRSHFSAVPPVKGLDSWAECLDGKLRLVFEPDLPSAPSYSAWLKGNLKSRQIVPYLIDATAGLGEGRGGKQQLLEGRTWSDAAIVNDDNGFAVVFESKIVSDISHDVRYDSMRNQIARNIDVLLEPAEQSSSFLSHRLPERTLFALLTPAMYKRNPSSRLYGWIMNEYMGTPQALARDLPHRTNVNWPDVSRRLGWLTWEDCEATLPGACPWMSA